jgi:flagellar biosynthesis chaperone FliJ
MAARDPLAVLARLRRLEVDQAKRQLTERLRAHALAEHGVRAAEAALTAEAEVQDDPAAFGAWLPRGLAERERAQRGLAHAATRSEEARAVMTALRAAGRAVEVVRDRRVANLSRQEARRDQQRLDELAAQRAARLRPRPIPA